MTTKKIFERGRGVRLLSQVGEDEFACGLCGSRNVRIEETPSMYAGSDYSERCDDCGAYTTTDPFTDVTTIKR